MLFVCLVITGLIWSITNGRSPDIPLCEPSNGILLLPTRVLEHDPLFSSQRTISPDTPTIETCGIVPAAAPTQAPAQLTAANVRNLTTDIHDAELASIAIGDDILGAAWINQGNLYVGIARGGNQLQVQRVDTAVSASLTFSPINRLHLAYEKDGRIYYIATDEGLHPSAETAILVSENGTNPRIALDSSGWAHIFFQNSILLRQAIHSTSDEWIIGDILQVAAVDKEQSAVSYPDDPTTPWNDYGFLVGYIWSWDTTEVRVANYTSDSGTSWEWDTVASFLVADGETLTCHAEVGYSSNKHPVSGEGESWAYVAWVTKRPNPNPTSTNFTLPTYETVNPLAPDQLANPAQIYAGLNATRWGTADSPHDAGLYQTIAITDTTAPVTFRVQVKAISGSTQAIIGIDPTGGTDAQSPDIIWSTAVSTPTDWTQLTVSTLATGPTATIFLRSLQDQFGQGGMAAWDVAEVENGVVANGSFEGGFIPTLTGDIPEGWTYFYQDYFRDQVDPSWNRDEYTLYAAWSADNGRSWSSPFVVTRNATPTAGTTGALGACAYPILNLSNNPPSVSFLYSYESGDPPPGTDFLRYGRPYLTHCTLGTADCTDEPGIPLLSRDLIRPTVGLLAVADPFALDKALLAWESLQPDYESRDLYATFLHLQEVIP